jgi:hypothetical protein
MFSNTLLSNLRHWFSWAAAHTNPVLTGTIAWQNKKLLRLNPPERISRAKELRLEFINSEGWKPSHETEGKAHDRKYLLDTAIILFHSLSKHPIYGAEALEFLESCLKLRNEMDNKYNTPKRECQL